MAFLVAFFLVAITSARRVLELAALSCHVPYLVIHEDKVVLRPCPLFLPKVVSDFHIKEDIVLPSLCPRPQHPREFALHTLDVDQTILTEVRLPVCDRRRAKEGAVCFLCDHL